MRKTSQTQNIRNLVASELEEKSRQGDYNADARAIRLALAAVLFLLDAKLNKGKPRGKIPRRRPKQGR